MSWMEGRESPVICSAVLNTLLTSFRRNYSLHTTHRCSLSGCWSALLVFRRKDMCCCALLTSDSVFTDQISLSVVCTLRNLVLVTTSTAVLLMTSGGVAGPVLYEVENNLFCFVHI